MRALGAFLILGTCGFGQSAPPQKLTLPEAEQIALRNQPRLQAAQLIAEAAKELVTQARAAYYPAVSGNLTGVAADHSSTLAAGTLQTSSLYNRIAAGISVNQMLTDFGRTAHLTGAASLRAAAQQQWAGNTRAAVLIEVDQAYFQTLGAENVLRVAGAVVENRRLLLRQVQGLAQSSLKSTLDVSFAEVAASDAELSLVQAENNVAASRARLNAALGSAISAQFELADEPLPPALEPDPETNVALAIKQRPDLAALQLSRDAAHRFAQAEKALNRPTVSLIAAAGGLPATDPRLHGVYSAAGVNVNVPVLNGRYNSARHTEAELRAQAADKDVDTLRVQVSEQVRQAWLEANTAFRRLEVTARLVEQAQKSLRLARTLYDNGLGGIVELNQAQLSQVTAEISAASAKYQYMSRRAALAFVSGALR